MTIYRNVPEQDLINLGKLDEQEKNQRAIKNFKKTSKQTHDNNLAENFEPITKKFEEEDKPSENLGEIFRKTPQLVTQITKPTSQSCQSQTLKLVSASDEIFQTFSKMNDCKFFLKRYEISFRGMFTLFFH